jgi:hypothetical protein
MRTLFTSLAVLVAMTAGALAQHVTFDFDRSVDFHRFATYAWVQGPAPADPVNHHRIVNAVDRELAAKGLQQAVPQHPGPDLLVAYLTGLDRDVKLTGLWKGWGSYKFQTPAADRGVGGSAAGGTIRTDMMLRGTLIVDIIDARTNGIVWRGNASKEINARNDPSTLSDYIDKACQQLFKNFPPAR